MVGKFGHSIRFDSNGFEGERLPFELVSDCLIGQLVAADEEVQEYASEVPNSHLIILLIIVILPSHELRSLMLGTPKVLAVHSISPAVILIQHQTLQLPQFAHPHEVLGPQVPVPVSIHIDRVNSSNDLIEDIHNFLFPQRIFLYALEQVAVVRLSDVSNKFLVGYHRLDIQHVLLEGTISHILQDLSIELQAFRKAVLL